MPSIKIKVPRHNLRKSALNEKPEPFASYKKRRISSDNEDEDKLESEEREGEEYSIPSTSGQSHRSRSMSQSQPPDPEKLFEDDTNVDIVGGSANDDSALPARISSPAAAPSRKRGKKKAGIVYSDEDEEYVDSGRKKEGRDDDFIIDSPPRKAGRRGGGAGGGRGRGKGAKERGGGTGEIMIKDERKVTTSSVSGNDAKAGTKRRRETLSEANADATVDVESVAAATITQPSSTTSAPSAGQPQGDTAAQPPPPKMRKLPPIKKNKSLAASTSAAPSSGPSTPSTSSAVKAGAGATGTPSGLPIHTSLPRKPVQKTSDVDLFSPDIYNSLFKGGSSSAPRAGVNSRVKDEERRKELMKMRDEARAARMAQLQKNSFDLLAGQEKVARFEAELRNRNSAALYPNHLGAALRLIMNKRSADHAPGMSSGGG